MARSIYLLMLLAGIIGWSAGACPSVQAEIPRLSQPQANLGDLNGPNGGLPITKPRIAPTGLTLPSLWWGQEQFGGDLLEGWNLPAPGTGIAEVHLVVDPQKWGLLSYLDRYQFVHHLGSVARQDGYNTKIFSQRGLPLATYTCDSHQRVLLCCQIHVNYTGSERLGSEL